MTYSAYMMTLKTSQRLPCHRPCSCLIGTLCMLCGLLLLRIKLVWELLVHSHAPHSIGETQAEDCCTVAGVGGSGVKAESELPFRLLQVVPLSCRV